MLEAARLGAPEGTWLRAERQTAGRGRLSRIWVSEPGNLFASTLVRLRPDDPPPPTLALVAGVSLFNAVIPYAPVVLKWPNDLMTARRDGGDTPRKLAGILLERHNDAVVVGFGVNLVDAPVLDRPTSSVAGFMGKTPQPGELLDWLVSHLERELAQWRTALSSTLQAWQKASYAVRTPMTVSLPDDETVDGFFEGLDADGALRLRVADGSIRAVHAGDVFLI